METTQSSEAALPQPHHLGWSQESAASQGHEQQPLLPHDGPILAQQSFQPSALHHQEQTAALGAQMGPVPSIDVSPIHHWITMLGHMPNSASLQGLHPGSALLSTIAQSQGPGDAAAMRPAAGDLRPSSFSPAFQGTGAFALLRPPAQEQGAASAVGQNGDDCVTAALSQHVAPPQQFSVGQDGLWQQLLAPHSEREAAPQPELGQQAGAQIQGEVHGVQAAPSHGHSSLSQAPQPVQAGQGGGHTSDLPAQPQHHKPPQATKSSRFRGVYKRQRGGRWEASIVHEGKNCRLGLHLTEVAAARAYDRVAIKKWGPQEAASKINFDLNQYDLEDLKAMSMSALIQAVRAEWRERDYPKMSGPLYHHADSRPASEQHSSGGVESATGPAAKRQRLDEGAHKSVAEAQSNGRRKDAEDDVEEETRERVPVTRSSLYRGVSTHKQSGKWVAQIKSGGKQIYLGFYTDQIDAAQAYDQALIHMQGEQAETNFPLTHYSDRMQQLQEMDFGHLVAALKLHGRGGLPRQPKAPASRFRGVAPDKGKKWRSQITTTAKTTVYLGLWADEEGAARAYDRASIAKRGDMAKTNFPMAEYLGELKSLQLQPFESLIAHLRSQASASVAAEKAAKRELEGSGTILAPMSSNMEDGDRSRYLQVENTGGVPFVHQGLSGDVSQQYVHSAAAQPQNNGSFQIGQTQIGRFCGTPAIGLGSQGYIINRNAAASSPDMLFRVVSRGDQEDPRNYEQHGQTD